MAKPFVIPKIREKVIYWQTAGGAEVSYPVSASYKGILRLSPNDDATLVEKEPLRLYDEETENHYRDSIDPAITQQFIRVSTSDGYFVGLRLSQQDVESKDIYVIGPAKFDMVRLYTTKNNAFKLKKNTALPGRVNTIQSALIGNGADILKDVSGVDAKSELDQSYILASRSLSEREFTYIQTTQLIRDLVTEALLDLATIPTGSIHYTPISIAEYAKLLKTGKPNSYYKTDNKETPNDPIIRDYLICDGCLYKNEDFPELAKILEGTRVDYWRYDTSKQRMVQATYLNDYSTAKQFRVPDLRARFIKSIILDKALAADDNNLTGKYNIDARPVNGNGVIDNHVHFITTGFYQKEPELNNYTTVAEIKKETGKRDKWTLLTNGNAGVLHPHNVDPLGAAAQFGWDYDSGRFGPWCSTCTIYPNGTQYFLSTPQEYDPQNNVCTPNVGLSSDDMYSCKEKPSNDTEISYNKRTDYNKYVADTQAIESYGMENTPECYCMLPLIKI